MKRAIGTYTLIDNKILHLAPRLEGSAGFVLLALAAQANYSGNPSLTIAEIMTNTGLRERTVERAISILTEKSLIIPVNSASKLRQFCVNSASKLTLETQENVVPVVRIEDAKEVKELKEVKEVKEEEETHVILEIETPTLQEEILSVSAIATPDALVLEPSKPKPPKKSLTREMSLKFVAIWNDNCGNLPQVEKLNSSRESAFNELFREYELDEAGTGAALVAAVRCVAADPFWNERKYGLTNLLRKGAVTAKAEKWRSSQPKTARVVAQVGAQTAQDAPQVTVGSQWIHPQGGQPLTVIEIHGNTVFFAPGGLVLDYWLSEMSGWKRLEGDALKVPLVEPRFHGVGVAA